MIEEQRREWILKPEPTLKFSFCCSNRKTHRPQGFWPESLPQIESIVRWEEEATGLGDFSGLSSHPTNIWTLSPGKFTPWPGEKNHIWSVSSPSFRCPAKKKFFLEIWASFAQLRGCLSSCHRELVLLLAQNKIQELDSNRETQSPPGWRRLRCAARRSHSFVFLLCGFTSAFSSCAHNGTEPCSLFPKRIKILCLVCYQLRLLIHPQQTFHGPAFPHLLGTIWFCSGYKADGKPPWDELKSELSRLHPTPS